jgi:uncharacterized protein (DUF302 family)
MRLNAHAMSFSFIFRSQQNRGKTRQIMHERKRDHYQLLRFHKERERNDISMRQTNRLTIEHIVVTSDRSYEQVVEALEAQLGQRANWDELQQMIEINGTFEQAVELVEQQLGTSGFTIFSKLELGDLLALAGKPTRAVQYALGNALLAMQIIEHAPEAALYVPLRLVVYENRAGKVVVAYERLTSQLAQYPQPEIAQVSQLVEQKLEALVAEATGSSQKEEIH